MSDGDPGDADGENDGDRFARLPETAAERAVEGRATREEILAWWEDRFGVDPAAFDDHTFWEKGAGKIWVVAGDATDGLRIEALGMRVMHTRQEHWKPTTNAAQRFGARASENRIDLRTEAARRFVAGEDQAMEWDGDWGYVIATREVAGEREPLGVGLYTYGELASMVATGRRRDLP
jgi:NOL1/NOP2/fmu family ribosome biogenesis protein